MQVLQLPTSLPGKCSLCGASDNNDGREYVDIGFELDFYGVIYFCTHCFSEISTAVGFFSSDKYHTKNAELESVEIKLSQVEAENVKLRVALSQLDFLGSHGATVDDDPSDEKPVESKRQNNPKSVKQIDESGSTNISKTGKSDKSANLEDLL